MSLVVTPTLPLASGAGGAASVAPTLAVSGTPPQPTRGTPYSWLPTVSGAQGNLRVSLDGGLPNGLSVNSGTGEIKGTPVTEQTTNFGLTFRDDLSVASLPGLSLTVAPSEGGGGFISTNAKLRDAYAAYKAGTRNMVIAGMGSSTLRGQNSGNGSTNMHINGWLNKLAARLVAAGEFARCDALFGNGSAQTTNTDLAGRDPRVVLSGNWYTDTFLTLGGRRLRAAAAARVAFTPQLPFNALREYHQTFTTAGSATLNVDGGASLGTIDRNTGVEGVGVANFSVPLAAHTINLDWASGSFGMIGMRPYRSDRAEIEFLNFAASSADITQAGYLLNPSPARPIETYAALNQVGPIDLFFIAIGRNEWDNGSSISTMVSQTQAFGERAETVGAVVCIVLPFQTGEYVAKNGAAYVQALRDLAASKGWLTLDFNTRFGAYVDGAPYESGDKVHKNDLGHVIMGDEAASKVFGLAA